MLLLHKTNTMRTIIITGASSGIGRAAAELFLKKGWQVIATARKTESLSNMPFSENLAVLPLDVTVSDSISSFMSIIKERGCYINALLNNAGYSVTGSFEDAGEERARRQFEVNVFGLMNITRAFLPIFRQQKNGTIINVASVAGHMGMPAFSLYCASKFAVEGFSESLSHELHSFGIKVKLVEPGPIKTDFYGRSMDVALPEDSPYFPVLDPAMKKLNKMGMVGLPPERVARTIYRAARSNTYRLRYAVGSASLLIFMRHAFPQSMLRFAIRKVMGVR
jgi:short-subunit dehydrogenase